MKENSIDQITQQILTLYNEYDLRVSGKINSLTAFQLVETIEKKYQTDLIQLSDGTKLWNLLRDFLYSNFGKPAPQKKFSKNAIKSVFTIVTDGTKPLHLPKNVTVCGFSNEESRKLINVNNQYFYYDINLDPFYEILGDNLAVFEWPEKSGSRRKYDKPIYSRYYVSVHIPFYTRTFWELLFNRFTRYRNYSIRSEKILQEIIEYISKTTSTKANPIDKAKLSKDLYDFITVFVYIKHFLSEILKKMNPGAVLIRCGYGRFPMALSQACRELGIPSIEVQHGLITKYLIPYNRTTPTDNKDCIPEYLLTHGEIYADLVRNGNLFEKNKVIATGYPYLENTLRMRKPDATLKHAISSFSHNILFTSQWIVASEIQDFVIKVAEQFEHDHLDVGILFKPHPYDKTEYADIHKKHKHLILIDKYEDIFKFFAIADIHSTVYSTSGLEAMAFAVPNIFVDIYHLTSFPDSPYIVSSPSQFVTSVQQILSNYEKASSENREVANLFFTPSPEKHFQKFFTDIGILSEASKRKRF